MSANNRTARRAGLCILAGLLAAALPAALPAAAQDEELMKVRASAEAPGGGVVARAAAVGRAEREIVGETLEAALALDDMTPLEPLVRQYSRFIRTTQLISYKETGDETQVEVECFVDRKELLTSAASILLTRMVRPPVVLVLMAERLSAADELSADRAGAAETALARELRCAKLGVAGTAAIRENMEAAELLARIGGQAGSPAELAARAGAQTVILGEAVVDETEPPAAGNVLTSNAAVTLRIYRGSDGSLLDGLSEEATVQSANPVEGAVGAVNDACAKLARDAALYAVLAAAPVRPDELIVTVEDPGRRDRFDQLVQSAQAATGQGAVEEIFFADDMARLRVKYEGRVSDFVDTILARKYEGFALEPRHVIQRDILLRVNLTG